MRKKGWIAVMAAGLVGLMACQKEESAALAERTEGAAVEWNIVWENTGNSRISLDEAGNGRFTEGDSLSVLAFAGTGMRKVSRLWLEQSAYLGRLTGRDGTVYCFLSGCIRKDESGKLDAYGTFGPGS